MTGVAAPDLWILVTYLVGSACLGIWMGRRPAGVQDFLVGGRSLPAGAVLLSIVATETSTVTFLSVPALAYTGDFTFLQIAFGYVLGRIAVALLLLPRFYAGSALTAYELLGQRFGRATKAAASVVFLVTRTLADGLRLYLTALVLEKLAGVDFPVAVLVLGAVTIGYTFAGGIKAVVWLDCVQFFVYIAGALLAGAFLYRGVGTPWPDLLAQARELGKLRVLDTVPSLSSATYVLAGVVGGAFLSLATHGADHMMVQRYLCARSSRAAAGALVASGLVVLVQFALFLSLGTLLFFFFREHPPGRPFAHQDEVFLTFLVEHLRQPVGVMGIVLGAVLSAAMSTLSSSLNASAGSAFQDLWVPLRARAPAPRTALRTTRGLTVLFGVLQVGVALTGKSLDESVVLAVLRIAGFSSGILLGVFFLGLFCPRASGRAALVALGSGLLGMSAVAFATSLAWPWYAAVGSLGTLLVGTLVSRVPWAHAVPAALLLVLGACRGGPAEEHGPVLPLDAFDAVDRAVAEALAEGRMPGCVVAVGRRSGLVFCRAYGDRSVLPVREAMTEDTVFDLASLTKPVATATSIFLLVERGVLRLDDPVAAHLPGFAQNGKDEVTVRQLLLHTGGLVADNPLEDYAGGRAAAVERLCALPLEAPPGERFLYSDVGFEVLGLVVEHASGQDLDTFTRASVFRPLGMQDTGFLPDAELRARAAPTEEREGRWLRGEVHDPRSAALGGVAGHAGLFSTARDLARFAEMLLGAGTRRGATVLSAATVAALTRPAEVAGGLRAPGWDVRSSYSSNRSDLYSPAAFGHGGFTGTALWIDPELDLYVVFLSSRLHPQGEGLVNPLAARIGSIAAAALTRPGEAVGLRAPERVPVLPGIDVLEAREFDVLQGRSVGLITNPTGLTRDGRRTADVLAQAPGVELRVLFSPEHGWQGTAEGEVEGTVDAATGLPVVSLYGDVHRPTAEHLRGLDALVFDVQDAGTRFYTYLSTLELAMEAAAEQGLRFVVLDRPNPLGGERVEGPLSDPALRSFTNPSALPVRYGMTVGELALLFRAERGLDLDLVVVPLQGWRRSDGYADTGLLWVPPSPNLRTLPGALLYPGVALLEFTNVSVGRGTDTPFEVIGAPWMDGRELAERLAVQQHPGVAVVPVEFTPRTSLFAGLRCQGVRLHVTDCELFRPVRFGLAVARALLDLFPREWDFSKYARLLANAEVFQALRRGATPEEIQAQDRPALEEFLQRRRGVLLYE